MKHLTVLIIVCLAVASFAASYSAEEKQPQQREKRFLPLIIGGIGALLGGAIRGGRSVGPKAYIPNAQNNNDNDDDADNNVALVIDGDQFADQYDSAFNENAYKEDDY